MDVPSDPWVLLFLPSWSLVTLANLQVLLQASSMRGTWGCVSETHTQSPGTGFPACCSCLACWSAGLYPSTGCMTFREPQTHPILQGSAQSRLGNVFKCCELAKVVGKNLLPVHSDGVFARLDLCFLVLLCQKSRQNHNKELTIWRTGSALDCVTFLTKSSAKASAQPVPSVLVTAGAPLPALVQFAFA